MGRHADWITDVRFSESFSIYGTMSRSPLGPHYSPYKGRDAEGEGSTSLSLSCAKCRDSGSVLSHDLVARCSVSQSSNRVFRGPYISQPGDNSPNLYVGTCQNQIVHKCKHTGLQLGEVRRYGFSIQAH